MRFKFIFLSFLLTLFSQTILAEKEANKGYKISILAPNSEGQKAYLAHYWKGQAYTIDSLEVSKKGLFSFSNDSTRLLPGQYLLYVKPDIKMDLLIDNEQENIHIEIDTADPSKSKISGNKDTKLFWEYVIALGEIENKKATYLEKLKEASLSEIDKQEAIIQLEELTKASQNLTIEESEKHKGTWFSQFIKSAAPIIAPHIIAQNEKEATENYFFLKNNFFANIDFKEPRLWHTNFFSPQIDSYLNEIISQHPDSIALESSKLVALTQGNDTCFKEMLSKLTNESTTSRVMGMENTWAKLAEDYIFEKNIEWIDDAQIFELTKNYELLKLNRIGSKAQNLSLKTLENDTINTNEIDANFTLLYFYSTSCSHCRTEMPKLRNDFYDKYKEKGLKIVAINLDKNMDEWKNFMEDYKMDEWFNVFDPDFTSEYWMKFDTSGTPTSYLLNKDKTIISRKLDVETLDKYLERIL